MKVNDESKHFVSSRNLKKNLKKEKYRLKLDYVRSEIPM